MINFLLQIKFPDVSTGAMIFIGCAVGFLLIWIFGKIADRNWWTDEDTLAPLYWFIPIIFGVLFWLISRT